jgi:hypothetical protein
MQNNKVEKSLVNILEDLKNNIFYSLNCHRIGIIEKFNSETQTADISIFDKRVILENDKEILKDYTLLINCPVVIPNGAKGGLTFSINQGDYCILLVNDRDIDNWYRNGTKMKPNTIRVHNLSDCIAIPFLRNKLNKLTNYNNNATELNFLKTIISLTDKIEIQNETTKLKDDIIDKMTSILNSLINTLISAKVIDPISGELPLNSSTISSLNELKNNDIPSLTNNINLLLK